MLEVGSPQFVTRNWFSNVLTTRFRRLLLRGLGEVGMRRIAYGMAPCFMYVSSSVGWCSVDRLDRPATLNPQVTSPRACLSRGITDGQQTPCVCP
jgi:hypothetical protein